MLYEFKSSILHRQCVGDMVGSYKKGSSQPSAQVSREQYQPTPHKGAFQKPSPSVLDENIQNF